MSNTSPKIEKITIYNTPDESPGYLLWRVSTAWRSTIEEVLKQHDLTHPQFVILATTAWLTKDNKKIAQIDISKASGLDPNTTSQVLRGLEKKKLIKRLRSVNERSKSPQVTPLGNERLAHAMPAVEHADEKFFSILTTLKRLDLITSFNTLLSK